MRESASRGPSALADILKVIIISSQLGRQVERTTKVVEKCTSYVNCYLSLLRGFLLLNTELTRRTLLMNEESDPTITLTRYSILHGYRPSGVPG